MSSCAIALRFQISEKSRENRVGVFRNPNLLFLAFLVFLACFLFKEFLAILSVFPFFPKDFRGLAGRRNPCLFGGFPCCFPKRQGKEDQGRGFSNNRFVLKPDVAIASEASILSKNSLAITDFHAKKTQHVQLFENPLPGTPPIRDSQKSGCPSNSCPQNLVYPPPEKGPK